jgi:hypothetical protein
MPVSLLLAGPRSDMLAVRALMVVIERLVGLTRRLRD